MADSVLSINAAPAQAAPFVPEERQRWLHWTTFSFERIPLPYLVIVLLAGLIVAGEQALEQSLGNRPLAPLTSDVLLKRLVLPMLTIYMLIALKVLKMTAVNQLAELRNAVQTGGEEFELHVHRMVRTDWRIEAVLLLPSIAVVFVWLLILRNPFPTAGHVFLPQQPLIAGFMLTTYVMVGWLGLTLIFSTIQLGRALGDLARRPLVVNAFDPANLLPFGILALVHSFSTAGVIFILLLGLGPPTELLDWAVILLASTASILALVVPIWGVHQQMNAARLATLARIYEQLRNVHVTLISQPGLEAVQLKELADRTTTLVALRKVVLESPNWPFRSATTVARAVTVAMSPLLYFVLTEIIRIYLIPLFGK